MRSADLLKTLGFDESGSFLRAGDPGFNSAPAYGHIFRRAAKEPDPGKEPGLGLVGVYTLRASNATENTPCIPTVYVCRSTSEKAAGNIHRLVWNQDVVPFILVETPQNYLLYAGFEYDRRTTDESKNLLRRFNTAAELAEAGFHAHAIDDGTLWRQWGQEVRPEARVDWALLDNLKALDRWLQRDGLAPEVSHALIGKYVYLHYLRDRDILSDRKLALWGIAKETVIGRDATLDGLQKVVSRLDAWLNGGVFPLALAGKSAPSQEHVRRVAATFAGDQPDTSGEWQLHLDFKAYNFSYIPIETLSVIYEQFLHSAATENRSRGREAGAYYTPIPVVNFMLAEMEDRKPLARDMRILDPSCGSGAFLVQCYRRLIEKEFPPEARGPTPVQLRDLLQSCIFGVDRDPDACSVAELSLILTLLDYCNPPDLEDGTRQPLPSLRGQNVFAENFFRTEPDCLVLLGRHRFDWVVGNPPWKSLNSYNVSEDDRPVWDWMQKGQDVTPVGSYEVAQAFAWEVGQYVSPDGVIGLLMPAMGLFGDPSRAFRAAFFRTFKVRTIANFANLTEVLFAGRSRDPAAAFFYSLRSNPSELTETERVTVYSPLVANQEATRPVVENKRNQLWSLVLNASEIREIELRDLMDGSALPWKIATWGSHHDLRLLQKVTTKFHSFGTLEEAGLLTISRGPELFASSSGESAYDVEYCDDVADKKILDVKPLAQMRRIFDFPPNAIKDNTKTFLRARGGRRGLLVCKPPHIVVSEAPTFAVFRPDYLVVPAGQIGIASPTADGKLLKAITLYLNSDFAFYYQFLTSRLGVKRPVASLASLRETPVPIFDEPAHRLTDWAKLHDRLVAASRRALSEHAGGPGLFDGYEAKSEDLEILLQELNTTVFEALGFRARERALVEDLVHVRLELDDGKLGLPAVQPPRVPQIRRYAKRLKTELDGFIGDELAKRHNVDVVHDEHTGMVQVSLVKAGQQSDVAVYAADNEMAAELERMRKRLRKQHAQWIYFDRNLQIFQGRKTLIFKPMQTFHWTESQAMSDAAEIISRTLAGTGMDR